MLLMALLDGEELLDLHLGFRGLGVWDGLGF